MSCCPGKKKKSLAENVLVTIQKGQRIATGFVFAAGGINEELGKQRTKVCRNCVNYDNGRCKECGCFIDLKTRVPQEECPIGRWKKQ